MLTTQKAAERLNTEGLQYTAQDVAELARKGIIVGSEKSGNIWLIPEYSLEQFILQQKNIKFQNTVSQTPERQKTFWEHLRDPVWQGIGAITGIIAIVPIIWGLIALFVPSVDISQSTLPREPVSAPTSFSDSVDSSETSPPTPIIEVLNQAQVTLTPSTTTITSQTLEYPTATPTRVEYVIFRLTEQVKFWQTIAQRKVDGTDVVFSPIGDLLAIGTSTGPVQLWRTNEETMRSFEGHTNGITSVAFSPDGNTVLSGSYDGTVRLWDPYTGSVRRELKVVRSSYSSVGSVSFSPNGETFAILITNFCLRSGCIPPRNNLELREVNTGNLQWKKDIYSGLQVKFPSQNFVAIITREGVELFNVKSGEPEEVMAKQSDFLTLFAFASGITWLATATGDKISIWEFNGELYKILKNDSYVSSIAFSQNGEILATGSSDGIVRLWDVYDGQLLHTLIGHTDSVKRIVFAPNDKFLASISLDGTIRLWGKVQ